MLNYHVISSTGDRGDTFCQYSQSNFSMKCIQIFQTTQGVSLSSGTLLFDVDSQRLFYCSVFFSVLGMVSMVKLGGA